MPVAAAGEDGERGGVATVLGAPGQLLQRHDAEVRAFLNRAHDAEIGPGANLGAGSITANYDGFRKHRTKVGKDARVGVDTMLVAPVEVGDGAYTGAGSVITEDVPAGDLGISRAEQENVEGFAERKAKEAESYPKGKSS